ncbi:L-threonylcarbamoyladenylate synthase [Halobellus sp. EA9]|uniref:L-threonylcarbamoyladenylate synthase n=1 Tax=Halobellus sp. EA9 TaxID=3421647 RepID=UPI003EBF4B64
MTDFDESPPSRLDGALDEAAAAIERGETVVYPTETVYGLGADATSAEAVERVFETKGRDRDKPLSIGVPSVAVAQRHTQPSERSLRFMRAFLPGPVTVVVERDPALSDAVTAGRDRVGVRIPDHDVALALFERVAPTPVTATSANRSGAPSAVRVADLDPDLHDSVSAVIDAGEAPGGGSTVVDPERNVVHRRGAMGDAIVAWLADETGTEPDVEG